MDEKIMAFDPSKFKDPDAVGGIGPTQQQAIVVPQQATTFDPSKFKDPDMVPPEPPMSATKAALTGLMTAVKDQALGIAQQAVKQPIIAGTYGAVGQDPNRDIIAPAYEATQDTYNVAKEAHPLAAMAGYGGGVIGTAAAIPGSLGSTISSNIGRAALVGADFAGSQYNSDLGDMAVGAATSAAIPAGIGAVKGVKSWLTGGSSDVTPELSAALNSADDAVLAESKSAMGRTGIHLTPGEASQKPSMLADEGRLKVSDITRETVENTVQGREKAIKELASSIPKELIPEGKEKLAAKVSQLYKSSESTIIPIKDMKEFSRYPAFQTAERNMLKELGPDAPQVGTIKYLDAIKKKLDDIYNKASDGGEFNKAESIKSLKLKITNAADKASPDYATARSGAQRIIIQKTLEDQLKEAPAAIGSNTGSLLSIKKAWFGSEANSSEFYRTLQSVTDDPAVIQKAKDLQTILNRLSTSKYRSLAAKKLDSTVNTSAASKVQSAVTRIRNLQDVFDLHDRAMVELISNPKWSEEVSKLAGGKLPDERLTEKFLELLTRATVIDEARKTHLE